MDLCQGVALQSIGVDMASEIDPGCTDESPGALSPSLAEDRIKDLFFDLSKLSADQRAVLLQERCGQDTKLRDDLQILLAAHDEAGRFLAGATQELLPDDSSLTQLVGRYKLLQKIGEGGFGTVYMAEQQHPVRRKVALKIIKPGMDSRQVIARFEAERQALAMMDHPNIARVLDAGATEAGRPYFVMELVDGIPITRYCDEQQLNPQERLELFIATCNGLQHAHQKGIIHRDIKPSNILVITCDGKPVPKIIDFGIAKALHQKLTEGTLFTQFGAAVGTLEYMSPEQTQRDAAGTDTRSDIYSLGVVLYELLAGSTPLQSKTLRDTDYAEMLRMIRESEPPRPSTRISHSGETLVAISAHRRIDSRDLEKVVSGDLDWIVMKALEKDRTRRYTSASDLARDIQRYLADEPVEACPPSATYRFRKFARKHRTALRVASAALILLLAVAAFSTWEAIRTTHAMSLAETRLQAQTEANGVALHRLFDARLAQAKASHLSRRVGQRLDSLTALKEATQIAHKLNLPPESFRELRNIAIASLALPDLRLGNQWAGSPTGTDHIDFDGNLERYARTDKLGAVSIRRVAGDVEIGRLAGSGAETGVLFSPDGQFLATYSINLDVWKLSGGEPVAVIHRPAGNFSGIDFSRDSRECAISDASGSTKIYDLASENPPRQIQTGSQVTCLALHPRRHLIAVAHGMFAEVRDLDSGKVLATLPTPIRINDLTWNPDGETLGVACMNERIYLWNFESTMPPFILDGLANGGIHIAFNHAGNLLVSTGWEGLLRLWDPHTGKQLFSTHSGMIPRFSRNDRLLAGDVRDGKIALWEVAAGGGEYRTLMRHIAGGKAIYECPALNHDGSLLAVGMQNGVCLWDLASDNEIAFIPLPGCDHVLFEKSGALLTNGRMGLLRWPIQKTDPQSMQIGPPQKLPVLGPICQLARSDDGEVVAVSQYDGGSVLRTSQPETPLRFGPHPDARYIAVSHDGRWVATGSQTRNKVKVWDARTGARLKELEADGSRVDFSPGDRWLGTTSGGLHLWSTQSWQMEREIGGLVFAFSPDARMLAVETGQGALRLVDPATGVDYAELEDPAQDSARFLKFSTDGTLLVATNDESQSTHIWDLRKIRDELAEMKLDWSLPAFGPERNNERGKHLRINVTLGELARMDSGSSSKRSN
jgi:serine/threonine protein kinase/WD40 repeat protein